MRARKAFGADFANSSRGAFPCAGDVLVIVSVLVLVLVIVLVFVVMPFNLWARKTRCRVHFHG
ncbi:hypothetical protein GCM10023086_66300 [Streptomyces venetus]|uniref:Uncharacterized protein n=1 Tax=Streptomyces venetus TaxID=1701086 RepID=A0ABP8H521_9ACTN